MRTCLQFFLGSFFLIHCGPGPEQKQVLSGKEADDPYLLVLGTVQDAGSPHAGCNKKCCRDLFDQADPARQVVSLGLVDPAADKIWLFEATPDFPDQLDYLNKAAGREQTRAPDGIFLTHAHIGHYTGLMYLGKEAMNSSKVHVYAMPGLRQFLENNGPWQQLVSLSNIVLSPLENEQTVNLNPSIAVTPFRVPHRDEYSETVGFLVQGPARRILFIPDIDKWIRWDKNIVEELAKADMVFIDGTFYDGAEISNRNIAEIPHPFVSESMELLKDLAPADKKKVHFIHFNHTNPLLLRESPETKNLEKAGFNVARRGQKIYL